MAHRRQADAYDYLATSKVSELTVAQLEQALENSFLNKSNIEFWKGPIVMHKLLEVGRTYPGAGMPIPEKSTIVTLTADAGGTVTLKPEGSETWHVKAMIGYGNGGTATTTMSYVTDDTNIPIKAGDSIAAAPAGTRYDLNDKIAAPMELTSSMWLTVEETGGAFGIFVSTAYTVVSL